MIHKTDKSETCKRISLILRRRMVNDRDTNTILFLSILYLRRITRRKSFPWYLFYWIGYVNWRTADLKLVTYVFAFDDNVWSVHSHVVFSSISISISISQGFVISIFSNTVFRSEIIGNSYFGSAWRFSSAYLQLN